MSQPPKSTMRAPSARWWSLRMVLRVMEGVPAWVGAIIADPLAAVSAWGAARLGAATRARGAAVWPLAGFALDLQRGVADPEPRGQHLHGHVAQGVRVHLLIHHQVRGHRRLARGQGPH